jgi:putative transposase
MYGDVVCFPPGWKEEAMALGRPLSPLTLSASTVQELERIAGARRLPYGLVRRARIILLSAEGMSNKAVAARVGLSNVMVGVWRRRFLKQGIMGLYDEPRPGGPRSITDEQVADLIRTTLQKPPSGATHWSCRSVATQTGISKSTVHRVWRAFGIQPHRRKHFTLSTDPLFVEKVRDIVGLYLDPPDHALVLCVDEKSQVQALERTQPLLPLGLGYLEGVTHNYERHGTTTLFAALDIASGKVLAHCARRHRHQDFLRFLNLIDDSVPADLDIHLVIDNYATHKHHTVRRWLGSRPRYHVHYTPTYGSWLNQVEIWFNIITQQAIRRGSFPNLRDLVRKIDRFVQHHNENATPFMWTATAESILAKLARLHKAIHGTRY